MRKLNTSDVFKVFRIVKGANLKPEIENIYSEGKNLDVESSGMRLAIVLAEAISNETVENDIYSLLADIAQKKPEDIKNQSIECTIETLKQISKENDLQSFFNTAASLTKN